MGSHVTTTSIATDNRLAVTDSGVGLSSSGSGNSVNFNILDGGAVKGAFGVANNALTFAAGSEAGALQFAQNSLSQMLSSVIEGQKTQAAVSQSTAETIGAAMQQAAQTQAAATAAAAATSSNWLDWVKTNSKNIAMGAVLLGVGWYVWKGRK